MIPFVSNPKQVFFFSGKSNKLFLDSGFTILDPPFTLRIVGIYIKIRLILLHYPLKVSELPSLPDPAVEGASLVLV
jgi:hypothetical protein